MKKVVTFGEIMLRLSPSQKGERLSQAGFFKVEPGGSESNVAIALCNLGVPSTFISKLPLNPLSEKIIQFLRQFGVNTSEIVFGGSKLGTFWTENGTGPRASTVIYDREMTSFSEMETNELNWETILGDSDWFHFSGISPALSAKIFKVLESCLFKIKIPYSVDLNFRSKLWTWVNGDNSRIREIMTELCRNATLISGNESDFLNVFQITDKSSPFSTNNDLALNCFNIFPALKYIAVSNRVSISASRNIWSGFLFVRGKKIGKYIGSEYDLDSVEDRVGTGDSFTAGIIYGLLNKDIYSFQEIIDFASTLGALNHTTKGDASRFSIADVKKVMENKGKGQILR